MLGPLFCVQCLGTTFRCVGVASSLQQMFFGPFPASFSLFSSLQYTVDRKQMLNVNNFLPLTGFQPRTSGLPTEQHNHCPLLQQMLSDFLNDGNFKEPSSDVIHVKKVIEATLKYLEASVFTKDTKWLSTVDGNFYVDTSH